MGTIEADTAETLQRYRRYQKRPFGATIEDKILIVSQKLNDVHIGKMKFLTSGDTFFNKWPTPLLPVTSMPTCTFATMEKTLQLTTNRSEDDLGEEMEDGVSLVCDIPADHVIPFPRESHFLLGWVDGWLVGWLGWLVGSLVGGVGCLVGWLAGWLGG